MGRREDFRFVTGQGQYTADIVPDNALHAVFVRSPIARGHLRHLSVDMARAAPDVVAVLTALEAAQDGVADMVWTGAPVRDDGLAGVDSPRPLLNSSVIRHLGEPICMVVAKTRQAAMDAIELVDVAYDTDDSVALTIKDLNGPLVWPESPDNIAALHHVGDKQAVDAALAAATTVVRFDFDVSKVTACPIEMRSALGSVDQDGKLCLTTSAQSPFALHGELAKLFDYASRQSAGHFA